VNQRALGTVSGIVGAGGNVGAVAAGYLFRLEEFAWSNALFLCGIIVTLVSFSTAFIRLQTFDEIETVEELAHKASEKIVFS
jgi:NNP family nitrate/nitrite transporter-like MFS transporter